MPLGSILHTSRQTPALAPPIRSMDHAETTSAPTTRCSKISPLFSWGIHSAFDRLQQSSREVRSRVRARDTSVANEGSQTCVSTRSTLAPHQALSLPSRSLLES